MSKPDTDLTNLVPTRTSPRPTMPVVTEEAPRNRRQPSRAKTVMIAGHFDADVSFAMHELCGKLTRQRGQRFTVQQALAEALTDWFAKQGATPPEGLKS
jgi:antitoxin-like ribbon-helix-helix protein